MSPKPQSIQGILEHVRFAGIPLIGASPVFFKLLRAVDRVAAHSNATVLIRGETGTGKELIARAIHYLGARRDCPFVPVNSGALPESLAENELFGHRAGAFTGATQESVGLVRRAHRGTLFLDEVDTLPAKAQVALLRFLQDGRFRPLGAAAEECVDVRVVAASNRCLEDEVRAGRFRQDLFYRLDLVTLEVPPLRSRAGDVRLLTAHFLQQCAQRYQMPDKPLRPSSAMWFDQYGWPGNVRQLENLIHREFLLSEDAELDIRAPGASSSEPLESAVHEGADELSYRVAKLRAVQQFDRGYLTRLIQRAQGNVTKAAQLAGKERRALGKLLKRYGISAPSGLGDGESL
ncbi:MAG TPA: sigma-54 dependent transcriptional regulator [Steroidobacteraceae bacterium]|nr:sigma-54 dependent transcriptional regulator [Steroidobacteraceae bacterium]